jgi:hypothetical protein
LWKWSASRTSSDGRDPVPTIWRAVPRALLAVIPLSVALAACGGSDDSEPASGATRQPASQRSTSPAPSPDAGIPERPRRLGAREGAYERPARRAHLRARGRRPIFASGNDIPEATVHDLKALAFSLRGLAPKAQWVRLSYRHQGSPACRRL